MDQSKERLSETEAALADTLLSISIVSKRLAQRLREQAKPDPGVPPVVFRCRYRSPYGICRLPEEERA